MTGISGRARAATAAAAGLILIAGCGGQPTVVPAGSSGLEVPAQDSIPRSAESVPSKAKPKAQPKTGPKAGPERGSASAPSAPGQVSGSTKSAAPAAPKKVTATTKPTTGEPAPEPASPATAVVADGPALPEPGAYSYALTGDSSLGPPPPVSTLTVDDLGGGSQLWTLDARRKDGAGLIEELTLSRSAKGVLVSAYRLDASTGIAGVILEFAPTNPVLLTPAAGKAGQTWSFDLGTSTDGCTTASGDGLLVRAGKAGSAKPTSHIRLTTRVRTVGPASCVPIDGIRVQDIHHPTTSMLPTRIDSDLRGTVAGVNFSANTRGQRTGSTPAPIRGRVAELSTGAVSPR